jgi:tetratricopeptide (TPR) repeat protein
MLGLLAYIQRDSSKAQQWWEKALAIDPGAAAAANNLAWLYAESKSNLDTALQLAETARAKYPDLPQINDTVGWVHHRKGQSGAAIPFLQRSVELDPGNAEYQLHLGLAYAQEGLDVKARAALQRALTINPGVQGAAEARQALKSLVF